jgi:hypothetical protein
MPSGSLKNSLKKYFRLLLPIAKLLLDIYSLVGSIQSGETNGLELAATIAHIAFKLDALLKAMR